MSADREELVSLIEQAIFESDAGLEASSVAADRIIEWFAARPNALAAKVADAGERIAQAIEAEAEKAAAEERLRMTAITRDMKPTTRRIALRDAAAIARATTNDTGVTLTPESGSDRNIVRPSTTPDDGDTP